MKAVDVDVLFQEGLVIIPISKGLVVLTRAQFIEALRAGKRWKRQQARRAREQTA